ncbi:unnamed protein product [Vitrella brassicaformis CCMP3155]|uniref:C3H1-type domain-containing protein n=1 Tax=Vitrella brassicaformis (strain CCMP3155) TaxID=1169540 RepID=A0A0G4EVS3_VITBC|nr:unnamed protein product [Vitrella brassicaformis CCMP3155]|eukprot:CEM02196.1 unnamed protein product [Vitrella brassicaformis CCMP3155]
MNRVLSEAELFSIFTTPCPRRRTHLQRHCAYGESCTYSHGEEERLRRGPGFGRSCPGTLRYVHLPCPDLPASRCERGDKCPYAHSQAEHDYHPLYYKTRPCLSHAHGTCQRPFCPDIHHPSERRSLQGCRFFMYRKFLRRQGITLPPINGLELVEGDPNGETQHSFQVRPPTVRRHEPLLSPSGNQPNHVEGMSSCLQSQSVPIPPPPARPPPTRSSPDADARTNSKVYTAQLKSVCRQALDFIKAGTSTDRRWHFDEALEDAEARQLLGDMCHRIANVLHCCEPPTMPQLRKAASAEAAMASSAPVPIAVTGPRLLDRRVAGGGGWTATLPEGEGGAGGGWDWGGSSSPTSTRRGADRTDGALLTLIRGYMH